MTGIYWNTGKLKLRAITEYDYENYEEILSKYNESIQRLGFCVFPPKTLEDAKSLLHPEYRLERPYDYTLFIEDEENNIVGEVRTVELNRRAGVFEYGIILFDGFQGKCYVRSITNLVLNFFFNELRFLKVVSRVYSFNRQCQKVCESYGLKEEGRLKNMVYTKGSFYDLIYYSMTSEEFNKTYGEELNNEI